MNDIRVREIAVGELSIVAHIYGESFDEPYPEPVASSLLRTPGAWCSLAFGGPDQAPMGFVIARVILDEAEVLSIGTQLDGRRQGVATALLQTTFKAARKEGARVVHLEVGEDNPGAVALYRKLGFWPTGRRPNYYRRADKRRVAAILMTCDLTDQQ
ncbi:MAG: GNAT family N-acetyltransferase [Rhodospirillaceae bacterium]|nr:GNAT family N-acetyltransferase [Rhodospirillaceae bacterium]